MCVCTCAPVHKVLTLRLSTPGDTGCPGCTCTPSRFPCAHVRVHQYPTREPSGSPPLVTVAIENAHARPHPRSAVPTEIHGGSAVSRRPLSAAAAAPAALPGAASGACPAVPGPAKGTWPLRGRLPWPWRAGGWWGPGLTLSLQGADPQQGEKPSELRAVGAGVRRGVGPATAR